MRLAALSALLVLTACAPAGSTADQTSSEKVVVTGVRIVPRGTPSNCPPAPDLATLIVRPLPIEEGLPPPNGGPPKRLAKVVKPDYPLCAELRHLSGIVDFQFTLEADGSVGDLKLLQEVPAGFGFAEAAIAVFPKWQFLPKLVDGKPVASTAYYRFTSKIN
jgi:hypothetical protein